MNVDEYISMQKKAKNDSAAAIAEGKSGHLAYLEKIIEGVKIVSKANLGVITIPLDRIAGTDTEARANAFSPSYYPLLDPISEFANKYMSLYVSCQEEGLREPVIGFEYLGKYYIREGNKRVSVSKQLGLTAIEGTITRYVPEKTDAPEVLLNYEYINFYEDTGGINYLYFSKLSSFKRFFQAVAGNAEAFTEDQKMDVAALYSRFKTEYLKKSKNPPISVSDALFTYVTMLEYDEVKDKTPTEIREDIDTMWKEFQAQKLEDSIVVSDKPLNKEVNLIQKIALKTNKKLKIAFVHMLNIENSSWVYAHELGRMYLEKTEFGDEMQLDAFFDVSIEEADDFMEELCKKNYNVIFSASAQHAAACSKVAINHPDVKILNCSLNDSTKFVRTYCLRTYEIKFLIGMIAGAMTQTGKIAYVADYPVYGTIASVNAFAMGVSTVNSTARVYLSWSSHKEANPEKEIMEAGCDIISNLDWSSPKNITKKFGLYANEENPVNLAAPLWDWGKLYETIIKGIRKGSWNIEENSIGSQSLSYWWGISSGALDYIYSKRVPAQNIRLIDFMKEKISKGEYNIFSGEIKYQDGTVTNTDTPLSYTELIEMDKLLWNIYGNIPQQNELKDETASLTKVQGVFERED